MNPIFNALQAVHQASFGGSPPHAGATIAGSGGGVHPLDVAAIIHALMGPGVGPTDPNVPPSNLNVGNGNLSSAPALPSVVGAPTPPPGVTAPPAGSYNPAQFERANGQAAYGAQLWESHHPYAMAHNHVPDWVVQALHHALTTNAFAPTTGPPAAPAHVPAPQPPQIQ